MTDTVPSPSPSDYVTHVPRIADLPRAARENYLAMLRFGRGIELDRRLRALVDIRVSQLNGCVFCLDLHCNEARELGETNERLDTLAGWRESPYFTASERAAFDLAEAMTKLTDGPVPDAVYDEAARQFDEATLTQLIFAVTAINSWNRLMVTTQALPLSLTR